MALHKHEPVPEETMIAINSKYSICECLRDIYWSTDDPDIKLKCRVATAMAKAMDKKIRELTGDSGWYMKEEFWDKTEYNER